MNKYISQNYRTHTTAGYKAKTDVERLMHRMGMRNIGLNRSEHPSGLIHFFFNLIGMIKASALLRRGDVLFLQYPLRHYYGWITRIAHLCGAKIVVLVHDLPSYRHKHLSRKRELRRLKRADYIIASNDTMAEELRSQGIKCPIGSLRAWDYLTATDPIPSRIGDGDTRVAYVGRLSPKSNAFILDWGRVIRSYVVDVFGSGFRMDSVAAPDRFYDHGFVDAEHIIAGMTSDYGLVWDGDSIEKPSGDFGEYLAMNTPHKLSLYIRAKVPVIVWSGSAVARFVSERGVGFAVDSLSEIDDKIAALSESDCEAMRHAVDILSGEMARGAFFASAAGEAARIVLDTPHPAT